MASHSSRKIQQAIHTNVLRPSSLDEISLAEAVEERFVRVCNAYLNIKGVCLVPPIELSRDMYNWRRMRVRHKGGDFRNTADELKSTQRIAQWTVDVNNKLRNQEPKVVEWG